MGWDVGIGGGGFCYNVGIGGNFKGYRICLNIEDNLFWFLNGLYGVMLSVLGF